MPAGFWRRDEYQQVDRRVWVDARTVWEHLGDSLWDWKDLPTHDRVQYATLCASGLVAATPDVSGASELVGLEGMSEAYGTLPYPGGLMEQPATLIEAFGIIRQVRTAERIREARNQALEWKRHAGGSSHGDE